MEMYLTNKRNVFMLKELENHTYSSSDVGGKLLLTSGHRECDSLVYN